jgi:hypothetical protein
MDKSGRRRRVFRLCRNGIVVAEVSRPEELKKLTRSGVDLARLRDEADG